MHQKVETDREINKARIATVFEQLSEKMKIDKCTLYEMISEILEEDGYVEFDYQYETLH